MGERKANRHKRVRKNILIKEVGIGNSNSNLENRFAYSDCCLSMNEMQF